MKFSKYAYLWPPRPEVAAPPAELSLYERQGYRAEIKKNGTCNVIAVSPDKKIVAMNRHNEDHKLWSPKDHLLTPFTSLPGKGWYVFVAELLHSKVPGLRDINYVHDVLVNDGEYLVGYTRAERLEILHSLFLKGNEEKTYSHYIVDDHTWIAYDYTEGFAALYDSLTEAEDEGLVLKNPKQRLQICSRQKSNIAGQVKVRKSHKNYSF